MSDDIKTAPVEPCDELCEKPRDELCEKPCVKDALKMPKTIDGLIEFCKENDRKIVATGFDVEKVTNGYLVTRKAANEDGMGFAEVTIVKEMPEIQSVVPATLS